MKPKIYFTIILTLCLLPSVLFSQATEIKEIRPDPVQNETKSNSIQKAGTTTRITSKDIDSRSDMELSDTLNMVPGMEASTQLNGTESFTMRGYEQDKVAVMVDGIPLNSAYDSSADVSQIPMAGISHLIVNRGVSSALYGTCGTIGSINIITKKPEKMFTAINTGYGENMNWKAAASHGAPLNDFYYWVNFSIINMGGYNVSDKLDTKERKKWFDKIVRYDLYNKSFSDIDLRTVNSYLNKTGKWEHTEFRKYKAAFKAGYNISKKSEAGVSLNLYKSRKKTSMYDHNMFSNYNQATGTWEDPVDAAYTSDGKKAVFQNQARIWPEDYSIKVSPYYILETGILSLKSSVFLHHNVNVLESYAATDHSVYMYTPSVYMDTGSGVSPVKGNFYSRHTDTSWGLQVLPGFHLTGWNTLKCSFLLRIDSHREEEKAFDNGTAEDVIALHGTGYYKTKLLMVENLSFALEDEITPVDNLSLSLGISYDVQNLSKHKRRSMYADTLNQYTDSYIAEDDSMIWGTRDSFNPVAGIVYEPVKNFLVLRSAASIKTKFPTLKAYSRISDTTGDLGIKPERSYNANAGFELKFMNNSIKFRSDYFYTRFDDKIATAFNEKLGGQYSVNLNGAETRGVETIANFQKKFTSSVVRNIYASASYTFVKSKNLDNSHDERKNMGDEFELKPEHIFTWDMRLGFKSGTNINIFGKFTYDQFIYAMKSRPQTSTAEEYSTVYFEKVSLNNPLMLNIKVSQKLFTYFNVYIMCKNIFDDYKADPFNPGAGRSWQIGGSAKF